MCDKLSAMSQKIDWRGLKKTQLKQELSKRNLSTKGTKVELIDRLENICENVSEIKPSDSVSNIGLGADRDSVLQEAAELAGQEAALKIQQEYELERFVLQQKQKSLELCMKKAAIQAKVNVYQRGTSVISLSSNVPKSATPGMISQLNAGAAEWVPQSLAQTLQESTPKSETPGDENPRAGCARSIKVDREEESLIVGDHTDRNKPKEDIKQDRKSGETDKPVNNEHSFHSSSNVTQSVFDHFMLPKVELVPFNGDPVQYWLFIRSFENLVERNTNDSSAKLARLLQYCEGKAHKVIESCAMMEPNKGYARARELLKTRFGDDFVIAQAWVKKVSEGGPVGQGEKLRDFADELRGCIDCLLPIGFVSEVSTQSVLVKIVQRLPSFAKGRWMKQVQVIKGKQKRFPNIEDLATFVEQIAEEANDPVFGGIMHQSGNKPIPNRKSEVGSASFNTSVSKHNSFESSHKKSCVKCKGDHHLFQCNSFKEMDVSDRSKLVRESRLCFNCLRPAHFARDCKLTITCTIPGCGKRHSKYLHPPSVSNTDKSDSATASCGAASCDRGRVALPVVAVMVGAVGSDEKIQTYALLDSGSTNTFCSERLIKSLALRGKKKTLSLSTLSTEKKKVTTTSVNLEVSPMDSNASFKLTGVYAKKSIPVSESHIVHNRDLEDYTHLKGLNLPTVKDRNVSLLIGQDNAHLILAKEVRKGRPEELHATRTVLGWVVGGPFKDTKADEGPLEEVSMNFVAADTTLDRQLDCFWKLEGSDSLNDDTLGYSVEDKQVLELWSQCVKQRSDGHYQLPIPFRHTPLDLPDSLSMAEARLNGLLRRLKKNPELHNTYTAAIDDLLKKGYAEKVESDMSPKGSTWYIPHHPVINTKKTRIVFDCAAQVNGVSLNTKVMQGPDITNKLLGVLLRFRTGPVAVMGDIEAMFLQVKVAPKDSDALRFLWWPDGDLTKDADMYRMTSHLFGGTWSPACCAFALRRTVEDHGGDYSTETCNAVLRNFYVDDCLPSVESTEKAVQLMDELTALLAKGGFHLTKWISNDRDVISTVSVEERSKALREIDLSTGALPPERALGVLWHVESDELRFKFEVKLRPLTRRGILSMISSIYDPLGLASPFTLLAKRIIQELTRLKLSWDEPIPRLQHDQWTEWTADLPTLEELRIPRCVKPSMVGQVIVHLHHFSDASEIAYGTVSYLRLEDENGQVQTSLVMSKSHLAPIKRVTIPRLELSGAALAAKVDRMLRRELDINIHRSFFWTDSMIVLQQIKNVDKRFQTFVANRISTIHDCSKPEDWRHVESSLNPADDVSRGLRANDLVKSERWIAGPAFLAESMSKWPVQPTLCPLEDTDAELKGQGKTAFATAVSDQGPDIVMKLINRYSSRYKLQRSIAWLLRIKTWLKKKAKGEPVENIDLHKFSVSEMQEAEAAIIVYVQSNAFPKEIAALQAGGNIPKGSPLRKLDPMLSNDGLVCVGGRIQRAAVDDAKKHQIILPKHYLAEMIIKSYHEEAGHVGREHVLALTRERFWIVGGRQSIRAVLRRCALCKRNFSTPCSQKMGILPSCRVTSGQAPFTFVGVDYFGPFHIKRGRSEVKRYGCIFTCMTIRAIHLEVAHSLDTDSFMHALMRFVSRRGKPKEMWCDNGTNFVGAEKELTNSLQNWNVNHIENQLLKRGIEFHFNPPAASHMGGVWERMIRTVRKVLTPLLKQQPLDDEALTTMMCQVESIVNSRPITTLSEDPKDLNPLTPNHLLLLNVDQSLPFEKTTVRDQFHRKRWKQVQYLADCFWVRWTREYLPTLQVRSKWNTLEYNFKVGDIVIVVMETSRDHWPLGRILEVYPGSDGCVRKVKILTQGSTLIRSVTKLCLLESVSERLSESS